MSPYVFRYLHRFSFAAILTASLGAMAQTTPAPPPPREPDYVTTKEYKSKVFIVQHGSAYRLRNSLAPLASGFKGASMVANEGDGLNTISVRDFPENLAVIEEALKRLDVAQAPRQEVEFHIHVLFASKNEGPSEGFPEELKDVLATLKSTLTYRSYTPAASFVQRAQVGAWNLRGTGESEMTIMTAKGTKVTQPIKFMWAIKQTALETATEGAAHINLTEFDLSGTESTNGQNQEVARIRTDLSLKDGEIVVVGTSVVRDRGLIVVLTARLLKS